MYTYLQNAIMMFNNPLAISIQLASQNLPVGTMCTFDADGVNNTYALDDDFKILDNSLYTYIEGDITSRIIINGQVDNQTPGVYEIMYTVSDKDGNTTQQMRTITVIEVENDN